MDEDRYEEYPETEESWDVPAEQDEAPGTKARSGHGVKGKGSKASKKAAVPEVVRRYAREAPEKLYQIAMDEATPVKVRADIWRWFAELHYGKPRQQVDMDASVAAPPVAVKFEGVLDEWSS